MQLGVENDCHIRLSTLQQEFQKSLFQGHCRSSSELSMIRKARVPQFVLLRFFTCKGLSVCLLCVYVVCICVVTAVKELMKNDTIEEDGS